MARKTRKSNPGYLLKLPDEMLIAAKAMAESRGQTLADYLRAAVRMKLITDAAHIDGHEVLTLISQATAPLTRAVNFGAVHAAATVGLLREVLRHQYAAQGLPDDLAREKADTVEASILGEALATFENPTILHQFGWIERPADGDNPPTWLADADNE